MDLPHDVIRKILREHCRLAHEEQRRPVVVTVRLGGLALLLCDGVSISDSRLLPPVRRITCGEFAPTACGLSHGLVYECNAETGERQLHFVGPRRRVTRERLEAALRAFCNYVRSKPRASVSDGLLELLRGIASQPRSLAPFLPAAAVAGAPHIIRALLFPWELHWGELRPPSPPGHRE